MHGRRFKEAGGLKLWMPWSRGGTQDALNPSDGGHSWWTGQYVHGGQGGADQIVADHVTVFFDVGLILTVLISNVTKWKVARSFRRLFCCLYTRITCDFYFYFEFDHFSRIFLHFAPCTPCPMHAVPHVQWPCSVAMFSGHVHAR